MTHKSDITEMLSTYSEMGGVMDFKVFNIAGATSQKEAHLMTAQKTLESLAEHNDAYFKRLSSTSNTNRDDYFKVTFHPLTLDDAGEVTLKEFFGRYFNVKDQRPILLGKTGTPYQNIRVFNDYYYYDDLEVPENIVSLDSNNGSYATEGYSDAFFNPPHTFGHDRTNYEIGLFFLEFNNILFDDINKITVYAWSTDCSNYFDAGKEWWGSHFWTVHNPTKDWYIGIAASTTD